MSTRSNMYPQSIFFLAQIRKISISNLKIIVFTAVINCSILHRRVIVMSVCSSTSLNKMHYYHRSNKSDTNLVHQLMIVRAGMSISRTGHENSI